MSDLLPTCPQCGELNDPGARVCSGCASWLTVDDALREKRARMAEIRFDVRKAAA